MIRDISTRAHSFRRDELFFVDGKFVFGLLWFKGAVHLMPCDPKSNDAGLGMFGNERFKSMVWASWTTMRVSPSIIHPYNPMRSGMGNQ